MLTTNIRVVREERCIIREEQCIVYSEIILLFLCMSRISGIWTQLWYVLMVVLKELTYRLHLLCLHLQVVNSKCFHYQNTTSFTTVHNLFKSLKANSCFTFVLLLPSMSLLKLSLTMVAECSISLTLKSAAIILYLGSGEGVAMLVLLHGNNY